MPRLGPGSQSGCLSPPIHDSPRQRCSPTDTCLLTLSRLRKATCCGGGSEAWIRSNNAGTRERRVAHFARRHRNHALATLSTQPKIRSGWSTQSLTRTSCCEVLVRLRFLAKQCGEATAGAPRDAPREHRQTAHYRVCFASCCKPMHLRSRK